MGVFSKCSQCGEKGSLKNLADSELCVSCFENRFGGIILESENGVYIGGHQKYYNKKDGYMYLTQHNFIFAHTERREERNWQITIPFHSILAYELVPGELVVPYFDELGNKQTPEFRISSKISKHKHLDWIDSLLERLKAAGFMPENSQQEIPNTPPNVSESANTQEPKEAKLEDIQPKQLDSVVSVSAEQNSEQTSNQIPDGGQNYKELYEQLKNSMVAIDEVKLVNEGQQESQQAKIIDLERVKNLEAENAILKEKLEQERLKLELAKQKKQKESPSKADAELLRVIQMRLAKGEITIEEYDALKERFD
jgi:hypothetical protein